MAHSPIVARDVIITECGGMSSAELARRPDSEIVRSVAARYLWPFNAVMSVGVHHGMYPFQKSALAVLGVPPLLISTVPLSGLVIQSPANPGRRVLPVRSCCIAAVLRSRFLAMRRPKPSSNASTSLRALAMARCSSSVGGIGITKCRNVAIENSRRVVPTTSPWIRACVRSDSN